MDKATVAMITKWLAMHQSDREGLARWMRDTLRFAGIKTCRALIDEAVNQ